MIHPANVKRVCEFCKKAPGGFTGLLGRKYCPAFLRIAPPSETSLLKYHLNLPAEIDCIAK
jgi:hypothetical protein